MTDQRSPWLLQHTPETVPPTLQQLSHTIRRRNQRRSVLAAGAVTGLLIAIIAWNRDAALHLDTLPIATNRQQPIAPIQNLTTDPTTPSPVQLSNQAPPNSIAITSPPQLPTTSFNLYARILDDTPVFHFDDQRGVMMPIGWIRSIDTVPVDLGPLSPDQIDTFQSVLDNKPPSHFF